VATYVSGDAYRTNVLSIDFDSDACEAELAVHTVDGNAGCVVVQRTTLPIVSRGSDEMVVIWNDREHRIVRFSKQRIHEKGREFDLVRVKGFGMDERGLAFVRFDEDELARKLERLEYDAHVSERAERGLPLGPHLEARFQPRYYHMPETAYVLSLILGSLSEHDTGLWEKLRVEPAGAVYATQDERDVHIYPEGTDYLPVTIIARDSDDVLFYNNGRNEDFRLGMLTNETDEFGDRIIRDRDANGSEISALRLALDKQWNPERY
jgi:hypothetical protein